MDEFLKNHYFIKFLFFIILGILAIIFGIYLKNSFTRDELKPNKENNLRIMAYYRAITAIFLGIFIIIISLKMLYEDFKDEKKPKNPQYENVEVKKT